MRAGARVRSTSPEAGPATAVWCGLSVVRAKREVYPREQLFQESFADATDVLGPAMVPQLQNTAVLMLRPDAVAGRRHSTILEILREERFTPFAARCVRVGPRECREVWRHQLNIATLDRLAIGDALATAGAWILVALHEAVEDTDVPASVRLSALKGRATGAVAEGRSLRGRLAAPNGVVTFIHSPDEPADIVRELGIFFDRPARRRLYSELATRVPRDASDHVRAIAASLEQRCGQASFDLAAGIARTEHALECASTGSLVARQRAQDMLACARTGGRWLPWRRFMSTAHEAGVQLPVWDSVMLGADFSQLVRPGAQKIIGDSGHLGWVRGEGVVQR